MAGSVNKVIIVGNLGADPEIKSFQNGNRIANLRIATSERWKDKDGNPQERTEWHSVTLDNDNLVRVAEQWLRKGSKVYVEGQLRTRKWQDRDGNDRYTTEVYVGRFRGELTLLDSRRDSGSSGGAQSAGYAGGSYGGGGYNSSATYGGTSSFDDLNDDVPF